MDLANFYVDKVTGTPADTLLAFGLAKLIDRIVPESAGDPGLRIEDVGDSYRISLQTAIRTEWVSQAPFFSLFAGLDTAKKQAALPEAHRRNYVRQQQRNQAYFEARQRGLTEAELAEQGLAPPPPDWAVWAVINQMSAVDAYNGLAELWYSHRDCFPALLAIILQLFSARPNGYGAAQAAWSQLAKDQGLTAKAVAAQLQVVNPGMGKGGNKSKADGLSIGGLSGFWIAEYLKFAGLFQASLPRTVKGKKDRKTYVLRPKALSWRTHSRVFEQFQQSLFSSSAIKMDILAVLQYCQVFLEQWKAGQAGGRFAYARGHPGDHVAAVEVIYYKHLGSAHATMNLSSLALPLWLPEVRDVEDATRFLDLLAEHRAIVRDLEEEKGDQYALLHEYRDFLSGRDLGAFYRFTRGYASHVMRPPVRGKMPRQFTLPNLEVLIMAHNRNLAPILQNEGFQHIAEAIRRSTVVPQYQKAQGRDTLYEIRYGLGDKLLRHAQYADDFVQELSRFVHDYNRENAQKSETRKQQFRSNITVDDVAAVVSLIDEYGAPTVANLLVAYGYARDPKMGVKEMPEPEADEEIAELS